MHTFRQTGISGGVLLGIVCADIPLFRSGTRPFNVEGQDMGRLEEGSQDSHHADLHCNMEHTLHSSAGFEYVLDLYIVHTLQQYGF